MEYPTDLKYSAEHEWVQVEDKIATVGITDYAQHELGDVVYVELPAVGDRVAKDDPFGIVESVKTVSDVFAPVSGTVVEVNDALPEGPEIVNEDPYGDAWMVRIEMSDPSELEDLMDAKAYEKYVEEERE